MRFSTDSLERLDNVLCNNCYKKVSSWNDDIYKCWIRYIKGYIRKELIKNTYFSNPESLKMQFRKHPCYIKIAKIRKTFQPIKSEVKNSPLNYPWFLGLYYADGCIKNKTQLCFGLSFHELLIENKVYNILKEILSDSAHIVREQVGNMRQVRTHSIELCTKLPKKKEKNEFFNLWRSFNKTEKLKFIAGFIDGDGSCSFDVGINTVQIYSKQIPFLLKRFYSFLSQYGYISFLDNGYRLYLSSIVVSKLKKYLIKKDINRPYNGSVNVKKAFSLMKKGVSIYKISKIFGCHRKTVNLALKQVYGIELISKYIKFNKGIFNGVS